MCRSGAPPNVTERPLVHGPPREEIAAGRFGPPVTQAIRSFAATLALSAMILRAFLPAGWMPNTDGVPGTPLVICSVDGLHHAVPAHDPARPSHQDRLIACPFAAAAHFASLRQPVLVPVPSLVASFVPVFNHAPRSSSRLALAHAARGPPASA
jgi:hypothetical protein